MLGVVFATSSRHPDQAYALAGDGVAKDIAAAQAGAPLDGRAGECAG